jgi:hypothetical protein
VPADDGTSRAHHETARLSVRPADGAPRAWDVQLLLQGLSPGVGERFAARVRITTDHPDAASLEAAVTGSRQRGPISPGGG